jgi:hypothetical protein
LRLWHEGRYKTYHQIPFEDRTIGGLLEEYYTTIIAEVEKLRGQTGELDTDDLDRLSRLEEQLRPKVGDRKSLRGLSEHQSLEVWNTPFYTGDPLTDYWEYRITRDLLDPEELDLLTPPPREMWSEPWPLIRPDVKLLPKRRLRAADFVEAV